jgi:phosphoglycolate phosphatase-like HAD superfamily hydrolase
MTVSCILFDFGGTLAREDFLLSAPDDCPHWSAAIKETLFAEPKTLLDPWMEGRISALEVAETVAKSTGLSTRRTQQVFVENCKNLIFFNDVRRYAADARRGGIRTAIVTLNADIFLDVIVPHYDLNSEHDLIVCSSEFGTLDKTTLCLVAVDGLGFEKNRTKFS